MRSIPIGWRACDEAQIVASLNHRNIAAIYRFEDRDSIEALVLEFIEGPTLAERISHGPIPLDQALLIASRLPRPSRRPTTMGSFIGI